MQAEVEHLLFRRPCPQTWPGSRAQPYEDTAPHLLTVAEKKACVSGALVLPEG